MYALSICLLASVLFGTLVGARETVSKSHHRTIARRNGNTYSLQDFYQAEDFFNQWSFFTGPDPTNGNVNYLDLQDAQAQGLAYVDSSDNSVVLAVDSTSSVPVGGNRNSVRITSNKSYNGGLIILDAAAMPAACAAWPSFWTVGPNWPMGGEIDIVEGVNNQPRNQMTLHSGTSHPCTVSRSDQYQFSGNLFGTNCFSKPSANSGCGIGDKSTASFGSGFNRAGGGVFALLWDPQVAISIWFFSRPDIPQDIINRAPTPATWGLPSGSWSAQTCDIADNFYNNAMVFDTTVCGGWCAGAYKNSGCPGTCEEMVANATNFVNAKWRINYVAVYQSD